MTKMTLLRSPARCARLAAGAALALVVVGASAGCGSSDDDPTVTSSATTAFDAQSTGPGPTSTAPSSSSSSPSSSSSSSSSPSSSSSGRTLAVTVQGKKVTPAPSTVDLAVGETLTLVVTSDHDDELHVHGFEVEASLKAGKPTSVALTGKEPGVYEVETHEPGLRLLKLAVR